MEEKDIAVASRPHYPLEQGLQISFDLSSPSGRPQLLPQRASLAFTKKLPMIINYYMSRALCLAGKRDAFSSTLPAAEQNRNTALAHYGILIPEVAHPDLIDSCLLSSSPDKCREANQYLAHDYFNLASLDLTLLGQCIARRFFWFSLSYKLNNSPLILCSILGDIGAIFGELFKKAPEKYTLLANEFSINYDLMDQFRLCRNALMHMRTDAEGIPKPNYTPFYQLQSYLLARTKTTTGKKQARHEILASRLDPAERDAYKIHKLVPPPPATTFRNADIIIKPAPRAAGYDHP